MNDNENAGRELPATLARRYGIVPLRTGDGRDVLHIATSDPDNFQIADDLRFVLGREVELVATPAETLAELLEAYCSAGATAPQIAPAVPPTLAKRAREEESKGSSSWVDDTLQAAIAAGASDLHFEPFGEELIVRQRVDGVLTTVPSPPTEIVPVVASRLKVYANLDIADRRLPQDGRLRVADGERTVDLRISTLPTMTGESVVLRVLDRSATRGSLADVGLPADLLAGVRTAVGKPHGLFVVTGPTSSGKTTTLACALQELNVPESKLLTIEDPVEYEIDGAMQVSVNPTAGLTFAAALRSFLRHDPDVIMVGEIRDEETARVAVQAALTGHLVLTTLHTNDAPSAVTRLADLGVEPFLIASALEGVLAQRLVRRVCSACRPESRAGSPIRRAQGPEPTDGPAPPGSGTCPTCHGTGYHGRAGIFEWLPMTESLRDLITAQAPLLDLRRHAIAQGLRPLRDEGVRLVTEGVTTMEEVLRCT